MKKKREVQREVELQKEWIAGHGGDEAGYIARYGSAQDDEYFGNGGEAIFKADHDALVVLEKKAAMLAVLAMKFPPRFLTLDFWGRTWTLVKTNAPEEYDYGCGITLYDSHEGDLLHDLSRGRYVLLDHEADHLQQYQLPRYASGNYLGEIMTVDGPYDVNIVETALLDMATSANGLRTH